MIAAYDGRRRRICRIDRDRRDCRTSERFARQRDAAGCLLACALRLQKADNGARESGFQGPILRGFAHETYSRLQYRRCAA
jgi:hypothetical protein